MTAFYFGSFNGANRVNQLAGRLGLFIIGIAVCLAVFPAWAEGAKTNAAPKSVSGTATKTPAKRPAAKPEDLKQEQDPALPAGATEYNKGVELFQIAQVQAEKGNANGQKQLLKEAIRRFNEALVQNPKLVDAQSNIGFAHLTLREYRKAIVAFEKALALNPQHLNTLNGLATAYAFHDEIDRSIRVFDQLTTLDPGNSQYFFNKGSVLQRARKIDDARKAYEQALRITPDDQRTLFNMGTLFENQGQLAQARSYYEKAKGVEIGNTIGLEALRRVEAIDASLNPTATSVTSKTEPRRGK